MGNQGKGKLAVPTAVRKLFSLFPAVRTEERKKKRI